MTSTERDEMERVAEYMEQRPWDSIVTAVRNVLHRRSDDFPEWADNSLKESWRLIEDDDSDKIFALLLRERLRTEPTCIF